MTITDIRINGLREPVGFSLGRPRVSFLVTDTSSRKLRSGHIRIVKAREPGVVLAQKEGEGLDFTGESFDLALEPRTEYLVHIRAEGDGGDSAEAMSRFETGKLEDAIEQIRNLILEVQ